MQSILIYIKIDCIAHSTGAPPIHFRISINVFLVVILVQTHQPSWLNAPDAVMLRFPPKNLLQNILLLAKIADHPTSRFQRNPFIQKVDRLLFMNSAENYTFICIICRNNEKESLELFRIRHIGY